MNFEFVVPGRVVFGCGVRGRLAECVRGLGRRVLLVSSGAERDAWVLEALQADGLEVEVLRLRGEPTVEGVREAVLGLRAGGFDWVLGCGGGGVVDAGKAMAALLVNPGDVLDYLEVIGGGRGLAVRPLPFVAVPTTAGTGAEATKNAVLRSLEHGVKVSLRDPAMLPVLALVDPGLCVSLGPELTAATGMDALTQLLEAWVSCKASPMTDALCARGVPAAVAGLRRAVADGGDLEARERMSLAALLSGMALANGGLGAVHGFAAPLGGRYGMPHGAVCAALLPKVWEVNLDAVRRRGTAEMLERFRQAAVWLTGDGDAGPEDGVGWLWELVEDLPLRSLAELGLRKDEVEEMVRLALAASSMKGNPLPLTEAELAAICTVG